MAAKLRNGLLRYGTRSAGKAVALRCLDPTRTQQHHKESCDINVLVRRFGLTGQMPVGARVPSYADYGDTVFDFQSCQNVIVTANRSFMSMPATVRRRFGNDPQEFLQFCSKPENLDEMRKLGLAVAKAEPEPERIVKVEVVPGKEPPPKEAAK